MRSARSRRVLYLVIVLVPVLFLLWMERTEEVVPEREGWFELPAAQFPAHPWGSLLKGRVIGLDPGHGGEPGDSGKPFEGSINLSVALALRDFLEADGAVVVLTRDGDFDVPLARRPEICEQQGAEVFVSIHHNSTATEEGRDSINYTSTYYHGDLNRQPASVDLARAVQRAVLEALRTGYRVPTPILSDHLIYKKKGFAVLRGARVPAILCEASFYTHPGERMRLRDDVYLRREAYGYYRGLIDYFMGGTPRTRVNLGFRGKGQRRKAVARVHLDDGLVDRGGWGSESPRVLGNSIVCTINGKSAGFDYDAKNAVMTVPLPSGVESATLEVQFQNLYKHSNHPRPVQLRREQSTWIIAD